MNEAFLNSFLIGQKLSLWWQKFRSSYHEQVYVLLLVWMAAMLWSWEFLLSLSMIGLIVLALFENVAGRLTWRSNLRENWRAFWQQPAFYLLLLYIFFPLISMVYSEDLAEAWRRVQVKVPFLLLPFVFYSIPSISRAFLHRLLGGFLLVTTLAAITGSLWPYLQNTEAIVLAMKSGQPFPTPSNHIRFSLAVALAILGGIALLVDGPRRRRWVYAALTGFLFVFIHVLSVRSGLVCFYGAFMLGAFLYLWQRRNFGWLVVALVGFAAMPFVAYQFVPSLRAKIDYARWDYQQYRQNKGQNYSDSERFISWEIGWQIVQLAPLTGVGIGDLKSEVRRQHAARFEEVSGVVRLPHNQFITTAATTGLVGLLGLLLAFFTPLFAGRRYRNILWLQLHVLFLVSLIVEATFTSNFGISLYLLWLLVGLNFFIKNKGG